jgi:hypothetical protein
MKTARYLQADVRDLAAELATDLPPARLREIADRLIRLGNELHSETSWRVANEVKMEAEDAP